MTNQKKLLEEITELIKDREAFSGEEAFSDEELSSFREAFSDEEQLSFEQNEEEQIKNIENIFINVISCFILDKLLVKIDELQKEQSPQQEPEMPKITESSETIDLFNKAMTKLDKKSWATFNENKENKERLAQLFEESVYNTFFEFSDSLSDINGHYNNIKELGFYNSGIIDKLDDKIKDTLKKNINKDKLILQYLLVYDDLELGEKLEEIKKKKEEITFKDDMPEKLKAERI